MEEPEIASERSRWNWLLILPIVLPLATFLFNRKAPQVFGFPLFYWLQGVFVLLGAATTVVVYRLAEKRR